jgi:hypothetical protein
VTYDVYSNDTCAGAGLVSTLGPVTVSAGVVPNSPNWTATSAGTFYFVADYSGDANNNATTSGCAADALTVTPASPGITTQLSTNSVTIGATVHDGSTLSGATASAGGTVTYDVYSNDTCAGAGLVSTLGPVTVSAGVVPNSPNWTATSAGTFYFVADYSGDANNNATTSGCAADALTVTPAPSIMVDLSPGTVAAGQMFNLDATLSGVTANAGGSVTYYYYDNDTCSGPEFYIGSASVANGVTSGPLTEVAFVPGEYYDVAVYSGDLNNAAMVSGCSNAPLIITP